MTPFFHRSMAPAVATVLVTGMAVFSPAKACDSPLTIGWEPYAPFQYLDEKGKVSGLDLDVLNAITQEMGCTLVYRRLPWKRHLVELQHGRVDLAASATYTEERAAYAYYSQAYRRSTEAIMVRQGSKVTAQTLESFLNRGRTLTVVNGYEYAPKVMGYLNEPRYKHQFEYASTPQAALKMVAAKRTDGVLGDTLMLAMTAEKLGLSFRLEPTQIITEQEDVYFMLSRETVDLTTLQNFNKALKRLKASGALQAMSARYDIPSHKYAWKWGE